MNIRFCKLFNYYGYDNLIMVCNEKKFIEMVGK